MAEYPTALGGLLQGIKSGVELGSTIKRNRQNDAMIALKKQMLEKEWSEKRTEDTMKLLKNPNVPKGTRKILWDRLRPTLSLAIGADLPEYTDPPTDLFKRMDEIEKLAVHTNDKRRMIHQLSDEYPDQKEAILSEARVYEDRAKAENRSTEGGQLLSGYASREVLKTRGLTDQQIDELAQSGRIPDGRIRVRDARFLRKGSSLEDVLGQLLNQGSAGDGVADKLGIP